MKEPRTNSISKNDFMKLKEKDVMLITNPGRMGDEDGSTFVIKKEHEYIIYRVEGWLYPKKELRDKDIISLSDIEKQFPKWFDAWKNGDNDKYKYIYMGFGNGLSVDHSIYSEYEPYLNKLVEEYLEDKEDKKSLKYAAIYSVWKKALIEMSKEK